MLWHLLKANPSSRKSEGCGDTPQHRFMSSPGAVVDGIHEQLTTFASLPVDALTLVAESLFEAPFLAHFAATNTACQAAAHDELRGALLAAVTVHLYVTPNAGPISDALVACPYFRLPADLVAIPPGAFRGCALTKLTLPATLTTLGDQAFQGSSLTELTIHAGSTLTTIGRCAFQNCVSLTEINLPASLTTISSGAFQGCSLIQLTLPAALTTLGSAAFQGNSSLKELSLPAVLETIGHGAFQDCISLAKLEFPASLPVSKMAFIGCTALSTTALSPRPAALSLDVLSQPMHAPQSVRG